MPCAAAVTSARDDERVHGARHADVAQTAFFLEACRFNEGARTREQAFFHAVEEDERELEALSSVQAHKCDLGALVVVVGISDQGSVIEELIERFGAVAGARGCEY